MGKKCTKRQLAWAVLLAADHAKGKLHELFTGEHELVKWPSALKVSKVAFPVEWKKHLDKEFELFAEALCGEIRTRVV